METCLSSAATPVARFQIKKKHSLDPPIPRNASKRLHAGPGPGAVQPPVHFEALHDIPRREPSVLPHRAFDRGRAVVCDLRILQRLQFR